MVWPVNQLITPVLTVTTPAHRQTSVRIPCVINVLDGFFKSCFFPMFMFGFIWLFVIVLSQSKISFHFLFERIMFSRSIPTLQTTFDCSKFTFDFLPLTLKISEGILLP